MSKIRKENFSLSRQEVPGIISSPFLDVVFVTRVLQNDMFCQALGIEKDFREEFDADNLRDRKIILIKYRERERERGREREGERGRERGSRLGPGGLVGHRGM